MNRGWSNFLFKPRAIFMDHVVVQYDTVSNAVSKSSYQARGVFIVVECTNCSVVRKVNDSNAI